jgi:hypothetical protein
MSQIQVTGEAKIRDIQGPVVSNAGVITALDGDASQYVRGDGTLADFPTSTGGGSSVSYYLNSSVSQGTIGGVAYRELSKDPIAGAGTDITISANGYVASYITDANDPALLEVPGGNFNCEFYFSVNSNAHNPYVYAELYKYDGTTFTLLGSSQSVPEYLTNGTTLSPYYFAIPVATAALTITDRLAIRIYVNVDGRTVTLHTENNHLCQVITTFSKGLTSLNNLTRQVQFFGTGTSGTDFAIVSSVATHTFNLPVASATNTGKLSSTDWSTFNGKVPYTGATANLDLGLFSISGSTLFLNGTPTTIPGYLYLKKIGNAAYINYADYGGITAYSNNFTFISDVNGTDMKRAIFDLASLTNNTARTFTLPDLSGTLALLEGNQEFSGYKTFIGGAQFTGTAGTYTDYGIAFTKGSTPTPFSSSTTNLYSDATTNNIVIRDNSSSAKLVFNNSTQTYTFPASSGTIALTSDIPSLANYVTLDGIQTITGGKTFTSDLSVAKIAIANSNTLYTTTGYTTLSASNVGSTSWIAYVWGNVGGAAAVLAFNNSAQFTYTFPSVSGTMALLEETQTFTGSKTFSSLSTKVEALGIKLNTSVVSTGGYLTLNTKVVGTLHSLILAPDSTTNRAEFTFDNSAIRTYALPNASGTIALLSGTQTFTGATTFSSNITVNSVQVGSAGNTTNIKFGDSTFGAITTGSNNIAIGSSALTSLTTSNANIGIGNSALSSVVDGAFNTGIGFAVGSSITSGSNNALFGYGAGNAITTGNYNTILGAYAGTAAMVNNIVLADGAGNVRYQWDGTNTLLGQSGNVGIGTATPNYILDAYSTSASAARLSITGTTNFVVSQQANTSGTFYTGIDDSAGANFTGVSYGRFLYSSGAYPLITFVNAVERMRITSAGNVGIGTSSPTAFGAGYKTLSVNGGTTEGGIIESQTNGVSAIYFGSNSSQSFIQEARNVFMTFGTNNTERMRLTSGGYAKFTNNGTYLYPTNNFFSVDQNVADWCQVNSNRVTSGTPLGIIVLYTALSPNSTGAPFYQAVDSTGLRFEVRSNGGIANYQANDVNLSDERTKKDIIPLESYWDKFKAIEIVKFKYKDQTHDDFNIGVIAQQVELVAPEFVDIDGWNKPKLNKDDKEIINNEMPLMSVYTSDLHHATIKVLQEAMTKIELLEARIKQLENK